MKNKIAFISGAGSGIGKATALELAEQGVHVLLSDINDQAGIALEKQILENGGKANYYYLDVADRDEIESVFEKITTQHGKIDYAVNNAGIGGVIAPIHEIKMVDWQRMMDVNLTGVLHCMQAELKLMLSAGVSGGIVNVASLAGLNGVPTGGPYAAAKHAVIGLTKTAAIEYASSGIRVNAICPGFVKTAILNGVPQQALDFNLNYRVPMKRLGKPQEIANAIKWLLSDNSSFMTGNSLLLDGGMMA